MTLRSLAHGHTNDGGRGPPQGMVGVHWPRLLLLTWLSHISESESSPQVESTNRVSARVRYAVSGSYCALGETEEEAGRCEGRD